MTQFFLYLFAAIILAALCVVRFLFSIDSLTDWLQVLVGIVQTILSTIGLFFVYKAFQQGNKNIEIQSKALRNQYRPRLTLVQPQTPEEKEIQKKAYKVFIIEVSNQDAIYMEIQTKKTKYITYYDKKDSEFALVCPERLSIGERFIFYCKYNAPEEGTEMKDSAPHLFVNIKIDYKDDSDFQYRQFISGVVFTDVKLDKVQYL
jgi:cell division protein FtsL